MASRSGQRRSDARKAHPRHGRGEDDGRSGQRNIMRAGWMEPGCYEVAPGVHRIPLQMPGDGLGAVNVYALETPDGLALVDGGWRVGTTFEEMERALLRIGHGTEQIHDIYVTHVHRDHYTFAVELRRRHGSRVHLGIAEA